MANPAEMAHGFMLTGIMLNVLLLGIMITQVYIYYTTYKRDAVWIKVFVGYLLVADLVNTALCYANIYQSLIVNFEPATTAIISTSVQLFFAWRTHILTRRWKYVSRVLVGVIILTALTSGVAGILTGWEVGRYPNFGEFQKFYQTVSTWLAASAACDALITMVLVIALRKQRTGFKRTDFVIDRVIKLTMQTGMLTMVVAALDLVFFLQSTSGLHLLFKLPIEQALRKSLSTKSRRTPAHSPPLKTNSLLSSLNARRVHLNGSLVESDEDPSKISDTGFTSTFRRDNRDNPQDIVDLNCLPRAEVFVQVEEHQLRDAKDDSLDEIDRRISGPKAYAV